MEEDKMNVGLYLREKYIGNNSLKVKGGECIKTAHKLFGNNINITPNVDNGESARSTKGRNRLNHMMLDVKNSKLDAIITFDVSRLSRNLSDLLLIIEEIHKSNIEFITVRESA